ncbi:ABC transporter substrate-binding protein (plasmid) [Pseudoalteromonas sp. T1lg65]|uniref:ABC transporter substrate-binding protein n=1 Tax=Pseudoalteromonas sp. T1lg65 TaxID=2077101 RepID=UPI003F7A1571
MKRLLLAYAFFLSLSANCYAAIDFNVLLVNPSTTDDPFWGKVQQVTVAAAKQLNVGVSVIYGEGNRHIQLAELRRYLSVNRKPDYVILINYPGGAMQTLQLLESHGVRYLTLEQTLNGTEKQQIGLPGENYKYWLGEVFHDNKRAGYLLADALLDSVKRQGIKDIKAISINGHYGSESDLRNIGASERLLEADVTLQQTVYAGWSKQQAYDKTLKLLERYPQTNLIWCASDLMAIGAKKALRDSNHSAVVGGFDWLKEAISGVETGEIQASVGGHFMMGAWALVTLYDHHYGHPYWSQHKSLTFDLSVITATNVSEFLWIKSIKNWSKIDYKAMSIKNQPTKTYQFTPDILRMP